MFISIEEIDRLIKEDVPYIDLTSWSLGIRDQAARITYTAREDAVVCGTEEVRMIFDRLGIKMEKFVPSGETVKPGDALISGTGRGTDIHMAWKVGMNVLEHCSGIATKTRKMVQLVKKHNPNATVLTTRKGFPGTKALAVKAVMAGGAVPHRLGLSETILVFEQHLSLIGGFNALLERFDELKNECCEKKIIVETSDFDEAYMLCEMEVDGIQFDKVPPDVLSGIVSRLKAEFPKVALLAAGGINEGNAEDYAKSGVDGIVTTSLYNAKTVDIGAKVELA